MAQSALTLVLSNLITGHVPTVFVGDGPYLFTGDGPSTLTLGVIGIVCLASYELARRGRPRLSGWR